jgi:poly(3-hydroxybutyrate) depolymerase
MTRARPPAAQREAVLPSHEHMASRLLAAALILFAGAASGAEPLRGYGADASAVTVSGISSGGFMAVQVHVAHSEKVKGAGVLAAGPWYCAQGSFWAAYGCMTPTFWAPLPPVDELKGAAERFAADGRIDPLQNLGGARVWLFSGTEDHTVERRVVEALGQFYAMFKVKPELVETQPAGHAMVTETAGNACARTEPPFINDCDYDAAGALLQHLLGPLAAPQSPPQAAGGSIVSFDQKDFAGGNPHAISMADTGYAYVQRACEQARCRVHVAFHGCRQQAEEIGDRFVREAGYNRWAEANRLIVLYPQTLSRYGWSSSEGRWSYIVNPNGCWDWWGYTNADYATKRGVQTQAVMRMVERLAEPRR